MLTVDEGAAGPNIKGSYLPKFLLQERVSSNLIVNVYRTFITSYFVAILDGFYLLAIIKAYIALAHGVYHGQQGLKASDKNVGFMNIKNCSQ